MNSTSSADSDRWMLHGDERLAVDRLRGCARNTSGATEYGACAARLARTRSVGASASRSRQRLRDDAGGIAAR